MVYFLRPSYSMSPQPATVDVSSGNNLLMLVGVPLAVVVLVLAVVLLRRPTMMGLCAKDDLNKDGKPKVVKSRVALLLLVVAALAAGATYGALVMMAENKSA